MSCYRPCKRMPRGDKVDITIEELLKERVASRIYTLQVIQHKHLIDLLFAEVARTYGRLLLVPPLGPIPLSDASLLIDAAAAAVQLTRGRLEASTHRELQLAICLLTLRK